MMLSDDQEKIYNQVRRKLGSCCLETSSGSVDYHTLERCPFYPSAQVFGSQMVKSIIEASDFRASWEELAGLQLYGMAWAGQPSG